MENLLNMIGPQIYSIPQKGKRCVSINIDLDHFRAKRILNLTGYIWSDQKFGIAMNMIRNSRGLTLVHDSDYLGLREYGEVLKDREHEVLFVLAPKDRTLKTLGRRDMPYCSPLSPGIPTASNARIRKAYDRLKEAGVKVKKFRSMDAMEKYLVKKQAERFSA